MLRFSSLFSVGILFFSIPLVSVFASFPDVGGREDTRAIEFLETMEVVQGYQDGTYQPERSISRAEFTKILVETATAPVEECSNTEIKNIPFTFSDVPGDEWFSEYICDAYKSGFIAGYPDGTFGPHQEINLAEAAKIVTLSQNIELDTATSGEWYEIFVNALADERALNPNLVQGESSSINRGVMADMIWRLSTGNEVYETDEPQEISSCIVLEQQIEKSQKRNTGGIMLRGDFPEVMMMESTDTSFVSNPFGSGAEKIVATPSASTASNDFSTTNIQEQGVDEADVIKNDGSHIFYARGENVKILKAYPVEEMKEESTIEVQGMQINELMLEQDTLIILGSRDYYSNDQFGSDDELMSRSMPIMPYSGGIEVRIFDVSDRTNPVQIRSVSLDGNLVSSRRVGETLYLISNNYLYSYQPGNPLPVLKDGDLERSIAPDCGGIVYFPNFTGNNIMTVAGVDISNPNNRVSLQNFLGAGTEVYASPKNLYIVQSDSEQVFADEDGVARWVWEDISKISQFSLNGLDIQFAAQGTVPGRVHDQYSMSEYQGNFRIATTKGWGDNRENGVFILDEALNELGSITGIAPEEEIKSVRFMGERGFVVTFKAVDPLFVIDMNPENPTILGELKIPGWSDYLHPISDEYLIGFGKEVNPESENNDRLTWDMLMGMKLAIFDVSDLENPKEIHKTIIGDRGTESEILRNPRSLFFDADRKLIGFPVQIQTKKISASQCTLNSDLTCSDGCVPSCKPSICDEESGICTSDCRITCVPETFNEWDQFETSFVGAQLYSYDIDSGFELQGQISHFPEYTENWWDQNYTVQRLVRIGENMFSVSKGMVKSADMNLNEQGEVSFLGEIACQKIQDAQLCSARTDCEVNWVQPYCPAGKMCIQVAEFGGCGEIDN